MHAHAYICSCLSMLIHMCGHKYAYSYTCPFICSSYMFIHVKHTHKHAYPFTYIPSHIHALHMCAHACPHVWTTCISMLVKHILLWFGYWEDMALFWYHIPHWWAFSKVRDRLSSHISSPAFLHVCVALWSLSKPWHELIVPATLCFSGSLKFLP